MPAAYRGERCAAASRLPPQPVGRAQAKRGGGELRVTLGTTEFGEDSVVVDLLMLDQSLKALEMLDPRGCEVLHLTYFAGLDRMQIADVLGISLSTVDRELRFARAWLSKVLAG